MCVMRSNQRTPSLCCLAEASVQVPAPESQHPGHKAASQHFMPNSVKRTRSSVPTGAEQQSLAMYYSAGLYSGSGGHHDPHHHLTTMTPTTSTTTTVAITATGSSMDYFTGDSSLSGVTPTHQHQHQQLLQTTLGGTLSERDAFEVSNHSSESFTAPTTFNVSHSLENSMHNRGATVRCQFCRQKRRVFFCADCVRSGDVTHSKAILPQRFSEKKLRLSTFERDRHSLAALVEEASTGQRQRDELRQRIELTRQSVDARRIALRRLEAETAAARADVDRMRKEYAVVQRSRADLPERQQSCRAEIAKNRAALDEAGVQLASLRERAGRHVRRHVQMLRSCIFPMEERRLSAERELEGSTQAELEDACCTNYIRGRWVYSNHLVDVTYSIGEPRLAAEGDYRPLLYWVQQQQEQHTAGGDGSSHAASEAAAGLMHLAQLVKVLAFLLDLKLPYALCFSEFAIETLTEEGLSNKVARLNANIVFMCASQRIAPADIRPREAARNVFKLLELAERDDLTTPFSTGGSGNGGSEGFEMNADLARSVEDALAQHLCLFDVHAEIELLGRTNAERERDSPDDGWEAVASLNAPEHAIFGSAAGTGSVLGSRQRSSSMSFFNSAASFMNNFWSTSTRPE